MMCDVNVYNECILLVLVLLATCGISIAVGAVDVVLNLDLDMFILVEVIKVEIVCISKIKIVAFLFFIPSSLTEWKSTLSDTNPTTSTSPVSHYIDVKPIF